jgi:hypothetical protein
LTVKIKVVDPVIDVVVVSFPVIVTVYEPDGEFEFEPVPVEELPPPPQPESAIPADARNKIAANAAIFRERVPNTNKAARHTIANPVPATVCALSKPVGQAPPPAFKPGTSGADALLFPLAGFDAPLVHAVELVLIVNVAVTAVLLVTAVSAMLKHPLVNEGLLVTVHEIVPVYPLSGVIVIVDVLALPAVTLTAVAPTLKSGLDGENPGQAINSKSKSIDPSPDARS